MSNKIVEERRPAGRVRTSEEGSSEGEGREKEEARRGRRGGEEERNRSNQASLGSKLLKSSWI